MCSGKGALAARLRGTDPVRAPRRVLHCHKLVRHCRESTVHRAASLHVPSLTAQIVAASTNLHARLLGISLASFSSGLGELTFLQLTTTLPTRAASRTALGAWASGTGAAGVAGAALWWLLRGLGVKGGLGISSVSGEGCKQGGNVVLLLTLPSCSSSRSSSRSCTTSCSRHGDRYTRRRLCTGHSRRATAPRLLAHPPRPQTTTTKWKGCKAASRRMRPRRTRWQSRPRHQHTTYTCHRATNLRSSSLWLCGTCCRSAWCTLRST